MLIGTKWQGMRKQREVRHPSPREAHTSVSEKIKLCKSPRQSRGFTGELAVHRRRINVGEDLIFLSETDNTTPREEITGRNACVTLWNNNSLSIKNLSILRISQ